MEDVNLNTLADEVDVASSDGLEIASQPSLASQLSEVMGAQFGSDEDALAAVKETKAFVGKAGKYQKAVEAVMAARGVDEDTAVKLIMDQAQVAPQTPDPNNYVSRKEFEEATFFAENQFDDKAKEVLKDIATARGISLREAADTESFKDLHTKAQAQVEAEKQKSVLHSNPRLGQVRDKMSEAQANSAEARKAIQMGDVTTAAKLDSQARQSAVDSVIEAFDIGQ